MCVVVQGGELCFQPKPLVKYTHMYLVLLLWKHVIFLNYYYYYCLCKGTHTAGRHGVWGVCSKEWTHMLDGRATPASEPTLWNWSKAFMTANLGKMERKIKLVRNNIKENIKSASTFFSTTLTGIGFVNISECQKEWKEQHGGIHSSGMWLTSMLNLNLQKLFA